MTITQRDAPAKTLAGQPARLEIAPRETTLDQDTVPCNPGQHEAWRKLWRILLAPEDKGVVDEAA